MSSNPLITTIIPTFRRPKRVQKAIQSVLNQTFTNFRVCVYDNASDDQTKEVVAEFVNKDSRVKYFCHPENIGAHGNFQYGLKNIDTPYFTFLSDDDFLFPEFFETALVGFQKHPDAIFSSGTVVVLNDMGEVIDVETRSWPNKTYFSPPDGLWQMLRKHLNWTAILFRKEVIDEIGTLDPDIKAFDVDYLIRITARYPFVLSKKNCAAFISHSDSYSSTTRLKLVWPGWLKIIKKIMDDTKIHSNIKLKAERLIKADLRKRLFIIAVGYLRQRKFDEALDTMNILEDQFSIDYKERLLKLIINLSKVLLISYFLFLLVDKSRRILLTFIKKVSYRKEFQSSANWISGS